MPVPNDQPSLLAQIDTELQAIQAKLTDTAQTGSNIGALIATTQTVITALADSANSGTGIGPLASIEGAQTLQAWIQAAIITETP